jgi:hypothetical protein
VITKYQGTKVQGVAQLTRLVRETPAGREVEIEVRREGTTLVLEAEVEERGGRHDFHKIIHKIEIPHIEIPDIDIPDIDIDLESLKHLAPHHGTVLLGVSVEALTGQLGGYFGVEDGAGVLVRSVKEGSAAQEAGLSAGDVITRIDGETIDRPRTLRRALRERRGEKIEIDILRERRERTLTATLPKEEEGGAREHRERMHEQRRLMHEERDRMRGEPSNEGRDPPHQRAADKATPGDAPARRAATPPLPDTEHDRRRHRVDLAGLEAEHAAGQVRIGPPDAEEEVDPRVHDPTPEAIPQA